MDAYERETRRMELEDRRQAAIDALPWHRKLGRWWGIVWPPITVTGLVCVAFVLGFYWVVSRG